MPLPKLLADNIAETVFITLAGIPVPKLRARVGRGHSYTPDRTVQAETDWQVQWKLGGEPKFVKGLQLGVGLAFYLPKPPSAPKSRRFATVKPDLDNLIKLPLDALNGLLWADDAQIVRIIADKFYCGPDAAPRTELRVRVLDWSVK